MKKSIVIAFLIVFSVSMFFMGIGCKEEAASEVIVETVTETVIETVEVEVESENNYTYKNLREMAKAGAYEGEPAKGVKVTFTNALEGLSVCVVWTDAMKAEWELAGGNPEDLEIIYSEFDKTKMLQIADTIYAEKPDAWIHFWAWVADNQIWGRRSLEEDLFMIGWEIPVFGHPFLGADNYSAGRLAGEEIVKYIEDVWGGWDEVDLVVTAYEPINGEQVLMRTLGPIDVLSETYGESAAYSVASAQLEGSKVVLLDCGGNPDTSAEAMINVLAANPDAKKIVGVDINAQGASGYASGAQAVDRWNADDFFLVAFGAEPFGLEQLEADITDIDISFFLDSYAKLAIPAVLANYYGHSVPSSMVADVATVTKENIDEFK